MVPGIWSLSVRPIAIGFAATPAMPLCISAVVTTQRAVTATPAWRSTTSSTTSRNSGMKPKRERKVYYAHYEKNAERHPVIRIGGKFLEIFGFRIGESISIEYEPEKITITKKEVSMGRITKD